MLRCIELAKKGIGKTYPNPLVGCVIVNEKKIIDIDQDISELKFDNLNYIKEPKNELELSKEKNVIKKSELFKSFIEDISTKFDIKN